MKQIQGQLSLFDTPAFEGKPYSYNFKRYIGQRVYATFGEKGKVYTVKEIEPYYTIITDGHRYYAGINVTIYPVEEIQNNELIERV